MKKKLYIVLACITVVGAIIIGVAGLKTDLIYSKNVEIDLNIGKQKLFVMLLP